MTGWPSVVSMSSVVNSAPGRALRARREQLVIPSRPDSTGGEKSLSLCDNGDRDRTTPPYTADPHQLACLPVGRPASPTERKRHRAAGSRRLPLVVRDFSLRLPAGRQGRNDRLALCGLCVLCGELRARRVQLVIPSRPDATGGEKSLLLCDNGNRDPNTAPRPTHPHRLTCLLVDRPASPAERNRRRLADFDGCRWS